MNTVIFSIYDCGCRSSALLLDDGIDWGMINKHMYKEQIPDADDIVDYDDEKLFDFFTQMFNAYIRRVVIEIDGHVYKVCYKCPRGFFGYEMVDGEVQETDRKRLTNAEQYGIIEAQSKR